MIDIHCHVLYGVDDGAQTLMTRALLSQAYIGNQDHYRDAPSTKALKPVGRQSKGHFEAIQALAQEIV